MKKEIKYKINENGCHICTSHISEYPLCAGKRIHIMYLIYNKINKLKELVQKTGLSVAELIRRAIDEYLKTGVNIMKKAISIIIFVFIFAISCATLPEAKSGNIILKDSTDIPVNNAYIGIEYNGSFIYIIGNDNSNQKTSIDPKEIKEMHLVFE